MTTTIVTITAETADDIAGKIEASVLDTPELIEDYGLTEAQAQALYDSIPQAGGTWTIPDWGLPVVVEEIENMIEIWEGEAAVDYDRANILRAIRRIKTFLKKLA